MPIDNTCGSGITILHVVHTLPNGGCKHMKKLILVCAVIALSAGVACAKDRIKMKVEGKDVDFNHKGHVRYNHGKCDACHPAVPQSEEPGKVNWMFCRGCHDQSLIQGGLKLQPIKK